MGIDSILNWFKLAPEDEDYDDDFADDYVEEEEVRPRSELLNRKHHLLMIMMSRHHSRNEPVFGHRPIRSFLFVRHQTVWKYVLSSQVISESHSRCAKF